MAPTVPTVVNMVNPPLAWPYPRGGLCPSPQKSPMMPSAARADQPLSESEGKMEREGMSEWMLECVHVRGGVRWGRQRMRVMVYGRGIESGE